MCPGRQWGEEMVSTQPCNDLCRNRPDIFSVAHAAASKAQQGQRSQSSPPPAALKGCGQATRRQTWICYISNWFSHATSATGSAMQDFTVRSGTSDIQP